MKKFLAILLALAMIASLAVSAVTASAAGSPGFLLVCDAEEVAEGIFEVEAEQEVWVDVQLENAGKSNPIKSMAIAPDQTGGLELEDLDWIGSTDWKKITVTHGTSTKVAPATASGWVAEGATRATQAVCTFNKDVDIQANKKIAEFCFIVPADAKPGDTYTLSLGISKITSKLSGSEVFYEGVTADVLTFKVPGGSETPELAFYGSNLTLTNTIAYNFYVEKSVIDAYDEDSAYVEFALEDGFEATETVTDYTVDGDYYVFSYKNIGPDRAGNDLTAVLKAELDGEAKESDAVTVSVKDHCYDILGTSSDAKLKTLAVDLLNYCAAFQEYKSYKTDALVNAELTAEQQALATAKREYNSAIAFEGSATDYNFTGAQLHIYDGIAMEIGFDGDASDVTVKVSQNGTPVATINEFATLEFYGDYYNLAHFGNFGPTQYGEVYKFTVEKAGTAVSKTLSYSVESYAYQVMNSTRSTDELKNLVQTMIAYGDSASAYAK